MGIWESCQYVRSEQLYWKAAPDSLRAAIRVEPDCWWCYVSLSRMDDGHAEDLLRTSLRLNQFNSEAAIDLGLRYEADGKFDQAESTLREAFAVDRTYAPRWTLANFYFRRDNLSEFWKWARLAAEMPAEDVGALFELSWRASPDPTVIESKILDNNPDLLRQWIDFLVRKDRATAAANSAVTLVRNASIHRDGDREQLFSLIDRMVAAGDAKDASTVWHELIAQNWIVGDLSFPNNPAFSRDPLPLKFDWTLGDDSGLHSWAGPSGLETEFTGNQPENCTVAEETVPLAPGTYRLHSLYRTRNIAPNTGLQWEIVDSKSDDVLAGSQFLSTDSTTDLYLPFSVKPESPFVRLRLAYHRQPGTSRIAGTLVVSSVSIQLVK